MEKKKPGHIENNPEFQNLSVNEGISSPPDVNHDSVQKFLQKPRKILTPDEYTKGILSGDITILSKAVTLIESSKDEYQKIAQEIIVKCLPFCGNSIRIGITGVPGVGKSTFIEALGNYILSKGGKIAVLAIDPSSKRSGGSILGDKTRMETLSTNEKVYIRPSPSAGSLGGVARKTRETIILCEAAGFNNILIETVGVGQSETAVHSMTDFFLLLMLAGAGDELQGIKRGIMEMADIIAINKADGINKDKAEIAKNQYQNALHLFPEKKSGWEPKTLTCSALNKEGINSIWDQIQNFYRLTTNNGFFNNNRNEQSIYWMYETIQEQLRNQFFQDKKIRQELTVFEKKVLNKEISSFVAANKLLEYYYKK